MSDLITLQNIAREAGVSIATVHRVMKNKKHVSVKTSRLVQDIAEKLGYLPPSSSEGDPEAIFSSSQSCFNTHSIGFLLIERPLELLNRTINTRLLSYIESNLSRYELLLNIIQVSEPNTLPATVSKERLDGVIMLGNPTDPNLRRRLAELNSIGVLAFDDGDNQCVDWVTSDYEGRGRMAVRYFMERGHHNVAYLNPQSHHGGFEVVGQFFVLEAKHKNLNAMMFTDAHFGSRWEDLRGRRDDITDGLVEQMLSVEADQRPTAVFIANDEMAVDLYRSLDRHGLKPMEDIDILSCDNDEMYLSQLWPRPATMDLNLEVMAERIVEKLLFRIRNPQAFVGIRTFVPQCIVTSEDVSQNILM